MPPEGVLYGCVVPVHALVGDSLLGIERRIRFGGLAHKSLRGLPVSRIDGLLAYLLRRQVLRAYIRCRTDWATISKFLSLGVVHGLALSSELGLVNLDGVGNSLSLWAIPARKP